MQDNAGYPEFVRTHGPDFSYDLAPRAKIFRRDAAKIASLADFEAMLRYNNFQKDEYSEHDPLNSICARGDLATSSPGTLGCIDTKATSFELAQNMQADAQNGPTHDQQTPFSWSAFPNLPHAGLPATFNFTFMVRLCFALLLVLTSRPVCAQRMDPNWQ